MREGRIDWPGVWTGTSELRELPGRLWMLGFLQARGGRVGVVRVRWGENCLGGCRRLVPYRYGVGVGRVG